MLWLDAILPPLVFTLPGRSRDRICTWPELPSILEPDLIVAGRAVGVRDETRTVPVEGCTTCRAVGRVVLGRRGRVTDDRVVWVTVGVVGRVTRWTVAGPLLPVAYVTRWLPSVLV